MRKFNMLPLAHCLPGFAGGAPTYAPSPVWRESVTGPVKWQALSKKKAVKLWHQARDFERRTRQPGRQDGALGRNGLACLHALIFDFLNYVTGRLEPAISSIAKKAGISARSAARGLASLKAAGVLNWLRRCKSEIEDGRFTLRQETNAYAILPASQWRGYVPTPEPPAPDPAAWGACPPLPRALEAAVIEQRDGGTLRETLRALESDPGDGLAAMLARLGRTMQRRESP